jgi:hypothetical protein
MLGENTEFEITYPTVRAQDYIFGSGEQFFERSFAIFSIVYVRMA